MLKSKSVHFFATASDLKSLLAAIELERPLQYVQAGMFDTPETMVIASGLQIPNLGFAPSGDHNHEPFWLITDANTTVEFEIVPQRRGGTRYGIDPGLNPESIVLWPGGLFENSIVVAGQVGTAMLNPTSLELLNLFVREFRRQFNRIKSFFVGPEAERLFDGGYRLAHSVTSAAECDLSRD
jgi:hypothetical protein